MIDNSGLGKPVKRLFKEARNANQAEKPLTPPEHPVEPLPPPDLKHAIADGMQRANATAQAMNAAAASAANLASTVANPGAAAAAALGGAADAAATKLVSGLAAAIGEFPAATLTNIALGIPHAHIKHPPSGPQIGRASWRERV